MPATERDMIRPADMLRLIENGRQQAPLKGSHEEVDFKPAVRLYLPFTDCVWLLTEVEPENPGMAFGLCDLGLGFPELGSVWLPELHDMQNKGLRVLQDVDWKAEKTLSEYATESRQLGHIKA